MCIRDRYYSKKLARKRGYEIVEVKYGPLPSGVKGNAEKMRKAFEMALIYATEQLAEIDFAAYDAVLFISKSVGTAVAAAYANKFAILPEQIYYTPVVESFDAIGQNGIVFHLSLIHIFSHERRCSSRRKRKRYYAP